MLFARLKRILRFDRPRLRDPSAARDEFLPTAQILRKQQIERPHERVKPRCLPCFVWASNAITVPHRRDQASGGDDLFAARADGGGSLATGRAVQILTICGTDLNIGINHTLKVFRHFCLLTREPAIRGQVPEAWKSARGPRPRCVEMCSRSRVAASMRYVARLVMRGSGMPRQRQRETTSVIRRSRIGYYRHDHVILGCAENVP